MPKLLLSLQSVPLVVTVLAIKAKKEFYLFLYRTFQTSDLELNSCYFESWHISVKCPSVHVKAPKHTQWYFSCLFIVLRNWVYFTMRFSEDIFLISINKFFNKNFTSCPFEHFASYTFGQHDFCNSVIFISDWLLLP